MANYSPNTDYSQQIKDLIKQGAPGSAMTDAVTGLSSKLGGNIDPAHAAIIAGANAYIKNAPNAFGVRGATSGEMAGMQGVIVPKNIDNSLDGSSSTSGSGSTFDPTEIMKKYSPNPDPLDDENLEVVSQEELEKQMFY